MVLFANEQWKHKGSTCIELEFYSTVYLRARARSVRATPRKQELWIAGARSQICQTQAFLSPTNSKSGICTHNEPVQTQRPVAGALYWFALTDGIAGTIGSVVFL
eukprot:IDg17260t1